MSDGTGAERPGLVELMLLAATMGGEPFEPADLPVPDHIAAVCPEPQTFTTPWGPVIVCGSDRLWFQDERGEWVEYRGRDLPESFRSLQVSGPGPTPPPEPPPAPPPSGLPVGWLAVGAVGLAALVALVGWIVLRDDPKEPGADENVVVATSTTSGAASTTQAPTTSTTDDGPGSTVATGPRIPAEVAGEAETALGLPSGALDGLVLVTADLPWQSANPPPADDGPAVVAYGAIRVGDRDVFVMMLDREITDPGVESAGTQLTVGRSPEVNEPSGLAGFADGYTERFFLGADGELTVLGDDGEVLTGADAQNYLHSMMGFFSLPSDESIARMGNFFREPTGAEATPEDPTAYQITPAFRVTADGLAPA
jgi:hypothetical protein